MRNSGEYEMVSAAAALSALQNRVQAGNIGGLNFAGFC